MYRCILISAPRYRGFRADAHWRNYDGLTLLGGDPMEESNQEGLLPLLQRIHKELPEKNIWAYTGYLYDRDLVPGGKKYVPGVTDQYLNLIDVLVDGPFVEAQKKITLNFRGSTNQRIVDLKETRKTGTISSIR